MHSMHPNFIDDCKLLHSSAVLAMQLSTTLLVNKPIVALSCTCSIIAECVLPLGLKQSEHRSGKDRQRELSNTRPSGDSRMKKGGGALRGQGKK